jgi:D-threo-aldose 1-dehydrogenase
MTDEAAREVVLVAGARGLTLFDTAPFYGFGLSERRMGDALRAAPPDGLILSTKVGRLLRPLPCGAASRGPSVFKSDMPFEAAFDYSYDGVMRSFEDSLQRLGFGRVDLLLVHDLAEDALGAEDLARHESAFFESGLRALEELRRDGTIRSYGFGTNRVEACEVALAKSDPDVLLLASRFTLLERHAARPRPR